jgi:UDP-N-acetylglucosamine 2-epimerase (non-hydrolysing)
MKVLHIVGARPNFMKLAPVFLEMSDRQGFTQLVLHTGQHYSEQMSDVFFRDLGIGQPDINLGIGSDTQARQVGRMMMEMDRVFTEVKPDVILVYGDVNSTLAAALVSSKLGIFTAHVEAGLRSFDREMPEEVNRLVTDALADMHFTPSADANEHLLREGIAAEKIHMVGNIMIDSLVNMMAIKDPLPEVAGKFEQYGVVTLHRPFNVDDPGRLKQVIEKLELLSRDIPLIFPVHPRTRKTIDELGYRISNPNLILTDPMPYRPFIHLIAGSSFVITDSGGIQEETTYLGVPCITLRKNTERPVTCTIGTNTLVGDDLDAMAALVASVQSGSYRQGSIPPHWDGKTAGRIVNILEKERALLTKDATSGATAGTRVVPPAE